MTVEQWLENSLTNLQHVDDRVLKVEDKCRVAGIEDQANDETELVEVTIKIIAVR